MNPLTSGSGKTSCERLLSNQVFRFLLDTPASDTRVSSQEDTERRETKVLSSDQNDENRLGQ